MPATLERLVVPIEWKAAEGEDENILVGYASTFGNIDLGGDVVAAGAFTKTIANIKANGIPLLADHMGSTASVLGTIFDAKQDAKGLLIKARISKAPSAQDVAIKAREGHLNKMSIGYEALDYAWEDREVDSAKGRATVRVRVLKEVKLWETSVVVFPMNTEAAITAMKSLVRAIPDEARKEALAALAEPDIDTGSDTPSGDVEAPEAGADVGSASTQDPASSETGKDDAASDEGEAEAAPAAAAADEAAEPPDEGAQGWDKWTSEAILADRPTGPVDEVTRARLRTLLELAEGQFDPSAD